MKFDKLTIKAQEALAEAQSLAQDSNHQVIDIPHLLIGLLSEEGIATEVLGKLGIKPQTIRDIAEMELSKTPRVEGIGDQVSATIRRTSCEVSASAILSRFASNIS